jgi:hypothetical protein
MFRITGLTPEAYGQIPPRAACLTTLELHGCGRLGDAHLLAIVGAAPGLTSLLLAGAFLVSDPAMQRALRLMPRPLERLALAHCPRVGTGTLQAVADCGARSLTSLALVGCDLVKDADLAVLAAARPPLTKLHMRLCAQLTDAGLRPLLLACGRGLVSLKLDGCTNLGAASTGLPADMPHTLPVAVPRPPELPARTAATPTDPSRTMTTAQQDEHGDHEDDDDDDDDDDNDDHEAGWARGVARGSSGRRARRTPSRTTVVKTAKATDGAAAAAAAVVVVEDLTRPVFALLGTVLCAGPRLVRLNVAATAFDDQALVAVAAGCPSLEQLDLTRTAVTRDGLGALLTSACAARLTHLSLNGLSDEVPADNVYALAKAAPALRRLDLSWMRSVDDDVVDALRARCPALAYLAVWGCSRLTEAVVTAVKRVPPCVLVGAFFVR